MKRNLTLITLLAALTVILTLTACGQASTTTSPDSSSGTTTSTTQAVVTQNPVLVTAFDDPEAYVTLPELNTITVSKADIEKKTEEYIQGMLASMGKTDFREVEKNVAAINGDCLNINYTGRAKDSGITLSEETMAGMTNASDAAGYDLVLGSGAFIPGFEEQLIGAKAGEKVTVDVTFPEGYSAELGGVAILFDVTVNSVSRAAVSEKSNLTLSVIYTVKDAEANDAIKSFLAEHTVQIDLADTETKFDSYFDPTLIRTALVGKNLFEEASVELTISAEDADDFEYESAVTLVATIQVTDIVVYPEELTDEDAKTYTNGEHETAESFYQYVYDFYCSSLAYEKITDIVTYGEKNQEVYDILYTGYYDSKLYSMIGDTSNLSEEELAARLTDAIKEEAETYAEENATAEYNDRMLIAYLSKKLNYTLTDAEYERLLTELYEYYATYNYMALLYSGITSQEDFELYFGEESLRLQFTVEAVIDLVGKEVTCVD